MRWQLRLLQAGNARFEHFLAEAAAGLDLLIERNGAHIRFMPMDMSPNPRDDLIAQQIRERMVYGQQATIDEDDPTVEEFVRRLTRLDVLVSGRLHGIILGLNFSIPFVGIDADEKIPQFAHQIRMDEYVIRGSNFSADCFYRTVMQALKKKQQLREKLKNEHHALRASAEKNRRWLAACLESLNIDEC